MIFVTSKKRKMENILKEFPGAFLLDVTSTSHQEEGRVLSPFYPHGNLIVPGARPVGALKATCVEAIWQALKVFKDEKEDLLMLKNDTGKGIKRTIRKHGEILGHRWLESGDILDYYSARLKIYLPAYWGMLKMAPLAVKSIELITEKSKEGDVVLLDYNVNDNFRDITRPLAHAGLIKLFIEREGAYPKYLSDERPLSIEEAEELKKINKKERQKRKKAVLEQEKQLLL